MNMMLSLLGGSPDAGIHLSNASLSASGNLNTQVTYRLASDHKAYLGSAQAEGYLPDMAPDLVEYETWLGAGAASAYEVRATLVAQDGAIFNDLFGNGITLFTGETGAWLNLGTSREWSVMSRSAAAVGGGFNGLSRTITLEIRNATTLRRVAVATVILTARKY